MKFPYAIPFVDAQGIELISVGEGRSQLRLLLREDQVNHLGMAHGGVLMTLLDVAMAQSARVKPSEQALITVEMKTSFFRPAHGELRVEGTLLHATERMAFTEASVLDARGRRCAHATGTFRYINPKARTEVLQQHDSA